MSRLLSIPRIRVASVLLALAGLHADFAWAAVTLTGVSGASNFDLTQRQIFGGIGGSNTATCGTNTSPCNSCDLVTAWQLCNPAMIDGAVILSLTFRSDTAGGIPFLGYETSTNNLISGGTSAPAKSDVTISITWGQLCGQMGLDTNNCKLAAATSTTTTKSFRIGFDVNGNGILDSGEDNTSIQITVIDPDPDGTAGIDTIDDCLNNAGVNPGICEFRAHPGDKKVYIDDAKFETGFPATGVGTAKKLRFFFNEGTLAAGVVAAGSPANLSTADLDFTTAADGSIEITDNNITGLTNDVPYLFRVGVVDEANNTYFFTSDANIIATCGLGAITDAITVPFDGQNGGTLCPYAATPNKVFGLLKDDLNCFIATAAFGSRRAPPLNVFRLFRNQFLLPSELGQKLVRAYYHYGALGAKWIRANPWTRPVVQAALWPAAIWSAWALEFGLASALLLLLSASASLMAFVLLLQRGLRAPRV